MVERSDFFNESPDLERAEMQAKATYEHLRQYGEIAHKSHTEYAKWLLASLLAVHGGAIYALNGLRTMPPPVPVVQLLIGASCNLSGVFLTLIAAFFTWLNFQFLEKEYTNRANLIMLFRADPPQHVSSKWVNRTFYLAAGTGLFSGFLFLASAVTVMFGLWSGLVNPAV